MNNPFNENDFNSGDGMLTSVWGPSLWHSLHTISFNYPVKPSKLEKKNYYDFFMSLKNILPCGYCRINYVKNIKTIPLTMNTMENRGTFSKWLYELHEEINKMLGKKSNLSYEDIKLRYEMFRSRCLDTSSKTNKTNKTSKTKTKNSIKNNKSKILEKGCVKPLYGKKSKCVISIVPKETKCKTFNIDKRCIIKK
tara:strand:- start:54 stop:638 length:585 start_codon:yes stop_codon:yes gene_type:complete